MEIYKVVAIGIVAAILIVYLKSVNSELAMPATVLAGIVLLIAALSYVAEFVSFFSSLNDTAGLDSSVFRLVIKIIAISYLVEFSASVIDDFGLKSISDKVVFCGKLLILTMSAPIIRRLIEAVTVAL
ncbi:MAG: hypothetical protein J5903_00700 [Clostridia bacterium]|nr:hypothetical protein [Clostridia bacterium]